jgi:hypothetical protein
MGMHQIGNLPVVALFIDKFFYLPEFIGRAGAIDIFSEKCSHIGCC